MRVNEVQHFLIALSLDGLFDDLCIDGLSAFEFLVKLHEIVRFVDELECLILGREPILDEFSWDV